LVDVRLVNFWERVAARPHENFIEGLNDIKGEKTCPRMNRMTFYFTERVKQMLDKKSSPTFNGVG
jgi:hypothetical protein